MASLLVDDLDNAVGGWGSVVDLTATLGITTGTGITPTVRGAVVSESGVTAGAVALQPGTAGPTGIVWGSVATPTTVPTPNGGASALNTVGVAGTTHVRAVVTTPIVGAKATVLITK
jgi:hypothetical protein